MKQRFLMVRIPIGNGSKNVTLMVVYAHPGRGKEANARNEHIFQAVVGFASGLGETHLMICGDLQHGPGTDAQTCWSSSPPAHL